MTFLCLAVKICGFFFQVFGCCCCSKFCFWFLTERHRQSFDRGFWEATNDSWKFGIVFWDIILHFSVFTLNIQLQKEWPEHQKHWICFSTQSHSCSDHFSITDWCFGAFALSVSYHLKGLTILSWVARAHEGKVQGHLDTCDGNLQKVASRTENDISKIIKYIFKRNSLEMHG